MSALPLSCIACYRQIGATDILPPLFFKLLLSEPGYSLRVARRRDPDDVRRSAEDRHHGFEVSCNHVSLLRSAFRRDAQVCASA